MKKSYSIFYRSELVPRCYHVIFLRAKLSLISYFTLRPLRPPGHSPLGPRVLGFLAGESGLVKDLSIAASDEPGETVDTGDEALAVAGDREPGVGPELGGDGVRVNLVRALKPEHGCGQRTEFKKIQYSRSLGKKTWEF